MRKGNIIVRCNDICTLNNSQKLP